MSGLAQQPETGTGALGLDLARRLTAEALGTGVLVLAVVGGVRWIEGAGYAYAMTQVDAQLTKKDTVRYRVLAIFRADGAKTELLSIHYSSPR